MPQKYCRPKKTLIENNETVKFECQDEIFLTKITVSLLEYEMSTNI